MGLSPSEYKGNVVIGNEIVSVHLVREPLDMSRHRFEEGAVVKGVYTGTQIDGLVAIGIDRIPKGQAAQHLTGLTRFIVRWNGRILPITPDKYRFVLNPSLTPSMYSQGNNSVLLLPGRDNSSVLVRVEGGDGVAGYYIWWAIRKSGEVLIFTEGPP